MQKSLESLAFGVNMEVEFASGQNHLNVTPYSLSDEEGDFARFSCGSVILLWESTAIKITGYYTKPIGTEAVIRVMEKT